MIVSETELLQSRGIEARQLGGNIIRDLLNAVLEGVTRDQRAPSSESEDVDRDLRPAVTLISAWVGELARQHHIDVALLATRSDITALLRNQPGARLAHGWRAQIVGDDIKKLVSGRAGLSFDSRGGLRLLDTAPIAREAVEDQ